MSDLTIHTLGEPDLTVTANDLAVDDGLRGAVLLSLFCDARAEPGDILPAGDSDRRGWWGSEFGGPVGSRLWLLSRAKLTADALKRAEIYARESLDWMLTERVASAVKVTASQSNGQLVLSVAITRPSGNVERYRYGLVWSNSEVNSGI